MKLLFDTSTLIAALVEEHIAYVATYPWLQRVVKGTDLGLVATHSVAELYAKLTKIPFAAGALPVPEVRRILERDVKQHFQPVALDANDYWNVVDDLSEHNLIGGIVYDALIVYTGIKADADRILTLNPRHFRQIYPNYAEHIIDPTAADS